MSQVSIIDIEGNHPEIPTRFDANVGFAIPIANVLEVLGETVPAGIVPLQTVGSGNTLTIQAQISQAIASTNALNVGLAAFDSAFFSVDANGFVSLIGGAVTESFNVDASTPPGTDPVVPNGLGIVTVTGGQVAAGTVGANVIRTNSVAANSYTIEIQRSSAQAVSTVAANGVAHFNSAEFTVDANGYVSLVGAGAAIDSIAMQTGTSPVVPDGAGLVTFNGSAVAAGTNPVRTNGTGANTMQLEVQRSQAIASTNAANVGLAAFNSSIFTVDGNGFVGLAISPILSVLVDGNTAPGTNPVVPLAGQISMTGAQATANTIASSIRAFSLAANTISLQIQRTSTNATTAASRNGVAHFSSAQFSADANGFVTLAATIATQYTGNTGTAAPAANNINILGAAVAAGTTPVATAASGSTVTVNVQRAQAIASTNASNVGLAAFNSAQFTVDANGFVSATGSVPIQFNADSGNATPAAGILNVLGRSGSKTSATGNTVTILSPPFADQASTTSVTLNSGSFATNAITLTTPVTAGLLDGDLVKFVATNGVLVVQMAATQVGHIGNQATSVAGAFTSTGTGDSLTLRYQASTNDWWAVGIEGNWNVT